MNSLLANINIVLVRTTHPGNIGSAARAMKNMGLSNLILVSPQYFPHPDATALAAGAEDVLENAIVVGSISDALKDTDLILGTSCRDRHLAWPSMEARECGQYIHSNQQFKKAAILFGSERTGLTNEELQHCSHQIHIPTNPEYDSLNLAQAVQVICYELRMAGEVKEDGKEEKGEETDPLATHEDLQGYYEHLEQTLLDIGYLKPDRPRYLMKHLRRLYNRAQPTVDEINILRGILKNTGNKEE